MSDAKKRRNADTQREGHTRRGTHNRQKALQTRDHQVRKEHTRWQQIVDLGEKLLATSQTHSVPRSEAAGLPPELVVLLSKRDLIVSTAREMLGGQSSLWLSPINFSRLSEGPTNYAGHMFPAQPASPLMQHALQTGQISCSERAELVLEPGAKNGIASGEDCWQEMALAIAVPLLAQDPETQARKVLGVLQIHRPNGPPFSAEDIQLFEGLAVQVGIALQSERQMAVEHWRVEQLSLVRKVSAQIADVRDLAELSRRVTHLIQTTFNYYYVAIFTREPGLDVLHFRASSGPLRPGAGGEVFSPDLVVHLGEGMIGHVAETGEQILARDISQEARFRRLDGLPETRSEVTLPLMMEDRVLGVLDVQSDQLDDFDGTDLLVLGALADNIATAVEGARLYGALRQRAEQLSMISEVSSAITSILDLDELLDEVVSLLYRRFGYPFVHLFTVHPGRRKIFYEAGSGALSKVLQEQLYALELDDPEGIVAWVARNGETILANDVDSEPRYRPSPLPPDETRAELAVPLIFGGEVLGVLDVQSDRLNAFGKDDRFLFEALASNIAIAMRNASLYHSERWRRQVADSLREVAGLLSANADLQQVLDVTLTELERSLPCDVAAFWLLNGEADETEAGYKPEDEFPMLWLAAVHTSQTALPDLEAGVSLDQLLKVHSQAEGSASHVYPYWLTDALESDTPVIRQLDSPFELLGMAFGFLADYSAIAAPLRVSDECIGVLTLAHHTPGRYGTEASAMTATFASYTAVAIENIRLYEATHEQAWVATVLLQVADATQSITNLNELLATVVRITPMLVGVKACALYVSDDGDVFVPAASYGLNRDQQAEFERWRFAPGDIPAFDRLRQEKRPVLLHNASEDPRLADILFAGLQADQLFETELLALVPLLAHGEVLGAILIDFSNDAQKNRLQDGEGRLDERLAIIQGIAHQTAVAVENIRLLKAQKEEAYVSVALLQVAQAVVSSNDLDDILGSIVRLTPILVGVKRSLLYLWDAQRMAFQLVQAYGIPRQAEPLLYMPGEFPLLDAARERESLVVYPVVDQEPAAPGPPDLWTQFIPPTLDEVDEYLYSVSSLLMAFPLAVKGEVLGVLLVEEPDAIGVEGITNDYTIRRLRDKRLEITTGISQQAALAIQNDRLQREMVKRERLESEMQLAREIQRTFLPDQLPVLPGWEISALWRTARQVGGDFYDVFDLPGQRLGLVIADVADKGMPAALFMTLIRTLVRATVQQVKSPAEVLARVNDVLVPDARQGMFVTIFYGVLSLETGELIYANAGHNPPLILRNANQELVLLSNTGMALGVEKGLKMHTRRASLEQGDYLIFYTDGVTEAFSSSGEMYGDERLEETVLEAGSDQPPGLNLAEAMLEAIDFSVIEFLDEAILSDDLTLMVLRREEQDG